MLLPILGLGSKLNKSALIWTDALTSLLADKEKRTYYATQAYQRVQDFTPSEIMQQWEALLNESVE